MEDGGEFYGNGENHYWYMEAAATHYILCPCLSKAHK